MTLEEYEKVLEEKRKALQTLKTQERKVDVKEFESMQQISNKKNNDDIFIKLGSDKDKRAEKEEKAKKEMTLEEYEKVLEEKRKALQTLKTQERKVDVKEFESMQQISNKKNNDDIFIKLGSDKDKRAEKEEKAKKAVSINEFLKPAEGKSYYSPGGRGRGRGRGGRGSYSGGGRTSNVEAPAIEDQGQFPTLGAK
ncbi:unnamed protein product [Ilex paraguariensis]|uniref:Hyaluronan/mRNA-binding protein domain-containing protein n=1 Tax=Ilex paraguariensis TaxID=185542 RepID=A0ABC8S0Q6_9AQUA